MTDNEQNARENAATLGCGFLIIVLMLMVAATVVKGCHDDRQSQNIAKQL
jgi:hypothetical protein